MEEAYVLLIRTIACNHVIATVVSTSEARLKKYVERFVKMLGGAGIVWEPSNSPIHAEYWQHADFALSGIKCRASIRRCNMI